MRTLGWVVAVLASTVCLTAGTAAAQDAEITEKARTHFRAGVNLLKDPDGARYEEAYAQFKTAYAESPSWKILGNLGICAMKLERDGEAIEAFREYLKSGAESLEPEERDQFARDLQTLEAGVVWVTLDSDPPGAAVVDSRTAARGPAVTIDYDLKEKKVLGIRPGTHRMVAKLEGREEAVWEFNAAAGQKLEHKFELAEPKPDQPDGASGPGPAGPAGPTPGSGPAAPPAMERPVPTPVFITLAATGALAVGAGVVGVLALGKKSEFDDANDGTDPDAAQAAADSGKTLNLVTDILIGGAVVAGAVTAVLYLNRPEVPAQKDAAFRVIPAVGRNAGSLTLAATF